VFRVSKEIQLTIIVKGLARLILNYFCNYFQKRVISFVSGGTVAADETVQGTGGIRLQTPTWRNEAACSSGKSQIT